MFSKILQIVCFFTFLMTAGCDQNEKNIINPSRPGYQTRYDASGHPVWGPTNMVIFGYSPSLDSSGLWLMRPDGTEKRPFLLSFQDGIFGSPAWSPDGRWLALDTPENAQIYRIRVTGDSLEQLTSGALRKFFPTWSPDGQWIAYSVNDGDYSNWGIWKVNVKTKVSIQIKQVACINPDWSPTGQQIAFVGYLEGHITRLAILDIKSGNIKILFRPEKFGYNYGIDNPVFSPDGSKIAFQTNLTETRDPEIWVVNTDGSNPQKLTGGWDSHFVVYHGGGQHPSWSPNGRTIIYARHSWRYPDTLGNYKLWMMDANGRNKRQLIF